MTTKRHAVSSGSPRRKARARSTARLALEPLESRCLLSGVAHALADVRPGLGASSPAGFVAAGALVFFVADDGSHGRELWKTDGTAKGTALVKDFNAGTASSSPTLLTSAGGKLFFRAYDGQHTSLWMSNGTTAGTTLVRPPSSPTGAFWAAANLTAVGGALYFTQGSSLYRVDPAGGGTALVAAAANQRFTVPQNLTDVNGTLYFTAVTQVRSSSTSAWQSLGRELWKYDPATAGAQLVADVFPGSGSSNPANLTSALGWLFFTADDGSGSGPGLWKTDGTEAGTKLVLAASDGFAEPGNLTAAWGTLFLTARGPEGRELWKSDGSSGGTVLVKDIGQGTDGSGVAISSDPANLVNVNGTLFFTAAGSVYHPEMVPPQWVKGARTLWKSDGTAAGTVRLTSSTASALANVNGMLYFAGGDGELWKSDGTTAGTVRVADIRPGTARSSPLALTNVDGRLFFTADNGVNGREPWVLVGQDFKTIAFQTTGPFTGKVDFSLFGTWQTIYQYQGTATANGAMVYDSPLHAAGYGAAQVAGTWTYLGQSPQSFAYSGYGVGTEQNGKLTGSGHTDSTSVLPPDVAWSGTFRTSDFLAAAQWNLAASGGRTSGSWSGTIVPTTDQPLDLYPTYAALTNGSLYYEYVALGPAQRTAARSTPITEVAIYWANGPDFAHAMGGPIVTPTPVYWNSANGAVSVSNLPAAPTGATHLLVVADRPVVPAAVADRYTYIRDAGGVISVPAPGLLANDRLGGRVRESNEVNNVLALALDTAFPRGGTTPASGLTASLVAAPAHGEVTVRPDGSFEYRPAVDFYGTDQFTYQAIFGIRRSAAATVSVVVSPPPSPGGLAASAGIAANAWQTTQSYLYGLSILDQTTGRDEPAARKTKASGLDLAAIDSLFQQPDPWV